MKSLTTKLTIAATMGALMLTGFSATAYAQGGPDHHDQGHSQPQRGPHHKKGERLKDTDWRRSPKVDYRKHHLRAPPLAMNGTRLTAITSW